MARPLSPENAALLADALELGREGWPIREIVRQLTPGLTEDSYRRDWLRRRISRHLKANGVPVRGAGNPWPGLPVTGKRRPPESTQV